MPGFPTMNQMVSALIFVIVAAQLSHAVPVITVDQSGGIYGNGMDGVAGIELIINYDSSKLSTPTVTKGSLVSQGMLAANTSVPGVIRIAIISTTPFSGSGQIAAVKFANTSGTGWIKLVSQSLIDGGAVKIPGDPSAAGAESESNSPTSSAGQSDSAGEVPVQASPNSVPSPTATTTTPPPTATVVLGSVNYTTTQAETPPARTETQTPEPVATSYQNPVSHQPEPDSPPPSPAPRSRQPAPDAVTIEPGQQITYKGVLDRFKTYQGDKSLPFMAALFRKEISRFIRQEPEAALSDGKTRIRIIVDLPDGLRSSPNFALDNATLISAKKDSAMKNRWIIEALPDAAVWKATLSIIAGEDGFEYPLTVAPPLGNSLKADQAGWNIFLKAIGTPQKPQYDFNKDGLRDYIDEFIFVVNHLAKK